MGRVAGPGEPKWTGRDRDFALAYQVAMTDRCPSCGTRESEWKRFGHDAYIGQQHYCEGCQRLEQEQNNIPEPQRGYVRPYLAPKPLARIDEDAF